LATTLQSFDAIHHFSEETKIEKCKHKYAKNKTEFSHAHHQLEHCKICDFTFSTFTYNSILNFSFKNTNYSQKYSYFHSKEITQFFKGAIFCLRAPPVFIA
jgi:hypothetical protein